MSTHNICFCKYEKYQYFMVKKKEGPYLELRLKIIFLFYIADS